jgi:hypothetical protein
MPRPSPAGRTALPEQQPCPVCLWVTPHGEGRVFADPAAASAVVVPAEREADDRPQIAIVGSIEAWELLSGAKLLRGVLLIAQAFLHRGPLGVALHRGGEKYEIARGSKEDPPHLLCFSMHASRQLVGIAAGGNRMDAAADRLWRTTVQRRSVRLPAASCKGLPAPLTMADLRSAFVGAHAKRLFEGWATASAKQRRQTPILSIGWDRRRAGPALTCPLLSRGNLRIGIAAPWLKLGGTDHCVIQLARAFRRLVPGASLHLLTTRDGIEFGRDRTEAFHDMILAAGVDRKNGTRLCDAVFRSMDMVINCQSRMAYETLDWQLRRPPRGRTGTHVAYLHVIAVLSDIPLRRPHWRTASLALRSSRTICATS